MPTLPKGFNPKVHYAATSEEPYKLLPFRFIRLADDRYFLSNEVGEFHILARPDLNALVRLTLPRGTPLYFDLKSKHFLYTADDRSAIDLLALKYRTRKSTLSRFTSLSLFVVTLRCDYSCPYCQVSRQTSDQTKFDMTVESANRALDLTFQSPSPQIKIEFQGGEPLLNFQLIEHVVLRAKETNRTERKDVAFVIATNLSHLSDHILAFCKTHDIHLSTSLDGPRDLHDKNRPRQGKNGHKLTVDAIRRAQRALGTSKVSALMTTTVASLSRPQEIVDEYVRLGFRGIFLRPLSPYGFAVKTRSIAKYDMVKWLDFYRKGLAYILDINRKGLDFSEYYSVLLLKRMLTHQPTSYVDLQSPAGIGIGAIVFNYDGDVYASDESRMLAEMGDKTFRLGNVHQNSYSEIFLSDALLDPLEESIAESTPMCEQCAFLPYCGSDPVYHHAVQGDFVGHKAFSGFCVRSMGMLGHLVDLLGRNDENTEILKAWIRR